jgi:hypothetical protein
MKLDSKHTRRLAYALTLAALAFGNAACSEDPEDDDKGDVDGGSAGTGGEAGKGEAGKGEAGKGEAGKGEAGTGSDEDTGVPVDTCDPTEKEVDVTDDIDEDTTWDCGTYILKDLIYVTGNSTLTIEPGVLVLGDEATSDSTTALIVTRGSKLHAVGTKDQPITFTSALPEGARAPGQWGGIVLLGKAKINTGTPITGGFENNIEGLDPLLATSKYGGTDDKHDCGQLEYVRIQFAGFMLSEGNELNGLTVGACGSDTKISHVQVHRGSDDGIEFFGGTAGLDHVLLSGNSDDSLDWDLGWRGNVQFVIVHQAENDGDKGFESDNLGGNETATPRSNPTIYNATMIGNPAMTAMHLREGTLGTFRNFLVQGFAIGVDLNATDGMADLTTDWPADLSIEHSVFFEIDDIGDPDEGMDGDDDVGFNEDDAITDAARNNVTDVDPKLGSTSITAPDYTPASSDLGDKATPPAGFDTSAKFAGAVDPDGDDWTAGWAEFPED